MAVSEQPQRDYAAWVMLATRASVTVAFLLIVVKAGAWLLTDSASMLASMTDSLLDGLASLFTFFAVRYAVLPADAEHRFGHGKAESLAALVQSALITGSAILLAAHSFQQFYSGTEVQRHQIGIYVSLFAIVVTLALVVLQHIVMRHTKSQAIAADTLHFRSDVLLNGSVLLAIYLTSKGFQWADSVFAMLIAGYLGFGAIRIGWVAFQSLMDRELPDSERLLIIDTLLNCPGIDGIHKLRTRSAGQTRFVQCHIELNDDLSLEQAHDITHEAEERVAALFPETDVFLHMDPQSIVDISNSIRKTNS